MTILIDTGFLYATPSAISRSSGRPTVIILRFCLNPPEDDTDRSVDRIIFCFFPLTKIY